MTQIVRDVALSGVAVSALPDGAVRYKVGERDNRPWGAWEVMATGAGYTVKRIEVLPGARLSLQYHEHRAEHWTIVEGAAEAEIDGQVHRLKAGEHVHVPLRAAHRITNPGAMPMVFIEVQVGTNLDERDIVRLQDDYGRQ